MSHVPREVRRQELVGSFLGIGYGISTEAELRISLTYMGAGLTDGEVSKLVGVIGDGGGRGVHWR